MHTTIESPPPGGSRGASLTRALAAFFILGWYSFGVVAEGTTNLAASKAQPTSPATEATVQLIVWPNATGGDFGEQTDTWAAESDQEWQVAVKTESEAFVYLIGYSQHHAASLIWPPPGDLSLGRTIPGEVRVFPSGETYLSGSLLAGAQSLLVVVSTKALDEISSTLVRIEATNGSLAALRIALKPNAIQIIGRSEKHQQPDDQGIHNQPLRLFGDAGGAIVQTDALQLESAVGIDDDIWSWFSADGVLGAEQNLEPQAVLLPAPDADVDPAPETEVDPQIGGLADALGSDFFASSGEDVPTPQDMAIELGNEVVLAKSLPIEELEDLLPPKNRGGVLPVLRFPAPLISAPMPRWPQQELVKIATATEPIELFLLTANDAYVDSRELVAQSQPPPEGDMDEISMSPRVDGTGAGVGQLFGKLLWWRTANEKDEPAELNALLPDDVATPGSKVHPEPQVVVVRATPAPVAGVLKSGIPDQENNNVGVADLFASKSVFMRTSDLPVHPDHLRDSGNPATTPDLPQADGTSLAFGELSGALPTRPELTTTSESESSDHTTETDWLARFSSFFSSRDSVSGDITEEVVIAPAEQVVGKTAEISQPRVILPASLVVLDDESGVITGPRSQRRDSVRLGQNRESALANATVLGGQGNLIRRVLKEVEEPPEPANSGQQQDFPLPATELAHSGADEPVGLLVTPIDLPDSVSFPVPIDSNLTTVSIDVESHDDVSASVVLVVSPGGMGTGTVIDSVGHILTNWHVVKDAPTALVIPKKSGEGRPDSDRVLLAKVVRLNRFSDLALLQLLAPTTLQPVPMAPTAWLERGQIIHAIGHPIGNEWRHTVAKVNRMKSNGTWHSGNDVTHRGSIISAQLSHESGDSGTPLFNGDLQLVGIGAAKGNRPRQLNALSLETIIQFLGDAYSGPLVAGD